MDMESLVQFKAVVKAGSSFSADKSDNGKTASGFPGGREGKAEDYYRSNPDKLFYNLRDSRNFCFLSSVKISVDTGRGAAKRKKEAQYFQVRSAGRF